jgi:hypothetical protein
VAANADVGLYVCVLAHASRQVGKRDSINTIAQIHQLLGLGKPLHSLISVVKHLPNMDIDLSGFKFDFCLYFISLKSAIKGAFTYGRTSYDFEEGSMVFVAPGQIIGVEQAHALDFSGWSLFFHADLLRRSGLDQAIHGYSFFNYELDEALQLSDKEKIALTEFVVKIEIEIQQNLDKHSQELIIHNLEAILKYSNRYYDRQFFTRSNSNKDFVAQFEQYINNYFNSSQLADDGLPTIAQCGQALHMSGGIT